MLVATTSTVTMLYLQTQIHLLQLPASSGRLWYFIGVYLLSFFNHRFFDVPEPIVSKLCHITWQVPKLFTSYVPLKSECRKPPIFDNRQFADPKSTLRAHHSIMRGKLRSLKQSGKSVARLGRPSKKHGGVHHPGLRSVVPLVGQASFRINITSAVWQLATLCLILGVDFPGQNIRWRHCHSGNYSTRATVKLGIDPYSSFIFHWLLMILKCS